MKKKLTFLAATAISLISPIIVFAQTLGTCVGVSQIGTLEGIICKIYSIIKIVIPVLILGAVAYFIWGIVQFITASDGEEKEAARGMMVNGIIGFAVILGLWGLVYLLLDTFGINTGSVNTQSFPTF